MTYAIIESLGRQYKVSVGDTIHLDKMNEEQSSEALPEGSKVIFTQVLAINDGEAKFGKPFIQGATVMGELVRQDKDKKVIAFKKKRRKGYHRKVGSRRQFSVVKIKEIKAA